MSEETHQGSHLDKRKKLLLFLYNQRVILKFNPY